MHPGARIDAVYLCRASVDFRKGIDGLAAIVEQGLQMNPFEANVYVFVNRHHTRLKALYWHRNGFCLWQKDLRSYYSSFVFS